MAEQKNLYDQASFYELQKWIEKIYNEEEFCPTLQPYEHNIELLLEIKAKNEEAEKNVKQVIKTKKDLIQFYNTKSAEMEILIKSEEVSLSDEIMKQIESLAELAMKMNLEEPDQTNFLLAICDLENSKMKKEEEKLKSCFLLSTLSKNIIEVDKQNEVLRRDLKKLEEIVEIQDSRKMKVKDSINFMSKKFAEYDRRMKLFESYLEERGYEPSIKHSSLLQRAQEVQELEDEVQEITNKLESYQALPPNETLTKLEIHKKKNELLHLEKEFAYQLELWEDKGK